MRVLKLPLTGVLALTASIFGNASPSIAQEAAVVKVMEEDIVAYCGTTDGPDYSLSVARNRLGFYDVYVHDAAGERDWVRHDWAGSLDQDSMIFDDQSHPSNGSMRVYHSPSDGVGEYRGGIAILDIGELRRGRSVDCYHPQRPTTVISCINNILNDPLHSVDIYSSGDGYLMTVKYLDGHQESIEAYGRTEQSRIRLYGRGWDFDVSWNPSYWSGYLTDPNGTSNMMICLQ